MKNLIERVEKSELIFHRLKEGDKFDVLGHLADLMGVGSWVGDSFLYEDLWHCFLPYSLIKKAGLTYEQAEKLSNFKDKRSILAYLKRIS